MRLATKTVQRNGPRDLFIDASDWRGEALRYGAAMVIIATAFIAITVAIGHDHAKEDASEVDTALMIDLPPAILSSNGTKDAVQGPSQTPTPATAADKLREVPDRPEHTQPPDPPTQAEAPRLPPLPKAADAPASIAREARAPLGFESPISNDSDGDDQERPHASAHAITQWQLSLMRRLQQVKRAFAHQARWSGTVRIAFEIDDRGELMTEQIAQSSGSTVLDQEASILIKQAAPFPPPPPGAGRGATSFIVPIVFRH